ncbi:MAG: glycosyltransferase family 2 protein [Bacteroidia bacterium]|nr:glycosyltransferase family 2 protein [Bacteroidia bacterium]
MKTATQTDGALSVIIIAGDEEKNIAACLESVSWAHERIVVCSSRADRTEEIARFYATRVEFREFQGYAPQKQYALDLATCEWVLSLDADERATSELRDEILRVTTDTGACDGYTIPRKNYFNDIWLRHGGWYPDRQLRLFRKSATVVTNRLVHEGFDVRGRRGELQSPMLHYTLPRVRRLLRKNLDYALYEAREKATRRRIGVLDFLLRPPIEFLKKYVFQRGFLDGWEGYIVALIHASNKLNVLIYLWEMQRRGGDGREE